MIGIFLRSLIDEEGKETLLDYLCYYLSFIFLPVDIIYYLVALLDKVVIKKRGKK